MGARERKTERQRMPGDNHATGEGGDSLEALRAEGQQFLLAGDEAIRRALSGDSEAFLRANRQRGGE